METNDLWIGIVGFCLIIFLLIGFPYGTYKYGRHIERRLLTEAYMKTMEQDYNLGFEAGQQAGMLQGYSRGMTEGIAKGKMEILKEEDENARY